MNGLPLPQLPAAEQITDIDPLKILTDRYTQMVKQVGVQFDQADQFLSRDTDNKLRMLDREYQIELDAMKRKYESVPKSQRDEQYFQRANQDWIQLNKKYALADERTRGRIRPDLEESNAKRQQTLQQLQQDFENRKIRMDQTKRIAEKYGWPQEYLLKEMYALAGHDVPVTAFKPPDPIERLIQLNMARADAEKQGDMGAVKEVGS